MKPNPHRLAPGNALGFFVSASSIGFLLNSVVPDTFPAVGIMVCCIASAVYFLLMFVTGHVRRSILAATGVGIWMGLRAIGLKNILYPILLILLLWSIEWGAIKGNSPHRD